MIPEDLLEDPNEKREVAGLSVLSAGFCVMRLNPLEVLPSFLAPNKLLDSVTELVTVDAVVSERFFSA